MHAVSLTPSAFNMSGRQREIGVAGKLVSGKLRLGNVQENRCKGCNGGGQACR